MRTLAQGDYPEKYLERPAARVRRVRQAGARDAIVLTPLKRPDQSRPEALSATLTQPFS